ncbi:MAG: SAM-dependent methyltransferase [Thermoplasmata archaeon]|nr:SAM-dependent methyltransferase [Thermoplasmata archaeon]MCI4342154.1 SAM-dependent methyltransferase [Thermoplasmata archaeon]
MVLPYWVLYAFLACIAAIAYFLYASFAFGAGYQPAPRSVVTRMLADAAVGPDDLLFDLGAGTGAIIFRAAREFGASAVGVEVDPLRVLILRFRRWVGGPRDRVRIQWGNLYGSDFRTASVVAVFLWPEAMERLRPLLEAQLRPGTRVVSHWHPVKGWEPTSVDAATRVYLYRWPEARRGASRGI